MCREVKIDTVKCNDCGSYIAVCPEMFVRNMESGAIEVVMQDECDYASVQEAIHMCPEDCITMEEV